MTWNTWVPEAAPAGATPPPAPAAAAAAPAQTPLEIANAKGFAVQAMLANMKATGHSSEETQAALAQYFLTCPAVDPDAEETEVNVDEFEHPKSSSKQGATNNECWQHWRGTDGSPSRWPTTATSTSTDRWDVRRGHCSTRRWVSAARRPS